MTLRVGLVGAALLLAGCTVSTPSSSPPSAPVAAATPVATRKASVAMSELRQVIARIEPVAEHECRNRTQGINCDLRIEINDDAKAASNAYQTLDKNGDPLVVFNLTLARETQNADEIAFVLGHEAAHHIRGHIGQTQSTAVLGAVLGGILAQAGGGGADTIAIAQDLGATIGARSFSKDYELEADQLGAIITAKAGYDPVRGVAYFYRAPDPGDKFLGTHPPNNDRIRIVQQTVAAM